jgi:hypothetical protein
MHEAVSAIGELESRDEIIKTKSANVGCQANLAKEFPCGLASWFFLAHGRQRDLPPFVLCPPMTGLVMAKSSSSSPATTPQEVCSLVLFLSSFRKQDYLIAVSQQPIPCEWSGCSRTYPDAESLYVRSSVLFHSLKTVTERPAASLEPSMQRPRGT